MVLQRTCERDTFSLVDISAAHVQLTWDHVLFSTRDSQRGGSIAEQLYDVSCQRQTDATILAAPIILPAAPEPIDLTTFTNTECLG